MEIVFVVLQHSAGGKGRKRRGKEGERGGETDPLTPPYPRTPLFTLHYAQVKRRVCLSGYMAIYVLHINVKILSHTRTVVLECCKGDDASQWGNGKFDPSPRPNPLTDRHRKLQTRIYILSSPISNSINPTFTPESLPFRGSHTSNLNLCTEIGRAHV